MDEGVKKARLIDWARRERAGWELLLAEVGEARMAEPGPMGYWSFKDLLSHLTAWQRFSQAPLEEALVGECPAPPWPADLNPDVDQNQINQFIYDETHEHPLPAVLGESRQVWDRLEEGLTLLPEQALSGAGYYAWTNGEALGPLVVREATAHFHQDHEAAVRSWLAGFRAPVDEG